MWDVEERRATLRLERFSATVNLADPYLGLCEILIDDCSIPAGIMQIDLGDSMSPEEPIERYVRGRDLIAVYPQTEHRDVAPLVRWSALDDPRGGSVGIELTLSAETWLLGSRSRVAVATRLAAARVAALAAPDAPWLDMAEYGGPSPLDGGPPPGLLRFDLDELPLSYLEMVHPRTDVTLCLERDPGSVATTFQSRWVPFPSQLEKGVLHRVRFRGLFAARQGCQAAARSLLASFLSSPLPLTA